MKEKCKNCKWWKSQSGNRINDGVLGQCAKVKMFWDCTKWDEDHIERTLEDQHKEDKAFVQDGSDYRAELLTREDFGCNQFVKN